MKTIAVIGGDGIGPEVTAEAVKVLQSATGGSEFDLNSYDLGADRWQRTGEVLPDSVLAELAQADAILLGAVGAAPGSKSVPSGLLERGLLLKLRFAFDHAVNLRPSKLFPNTSTPLAPDVVAAGPINFVVVREGTEGLYCGNGGTVRAGTPHEIATEVSVNTAHGVERVVRDAFERAKARRGHLTLLHKHNVLTHAGSLWQRIVAEVASDFPEVTVDYLHIDAAMIAMVVEPSRFDVVVTDNLFGDIVTDLAAAVTGGIGLAGAQEDAVQIAAVDHRIGIAEAAAEIVGQVDAGDLLGGDRIHQAQLVDEHRGRAGGIAETEMVEGMEGVRAELDAGADLLIARGALQDGDLESLAGQRDRSRQSANAAACDDDRIPAHVLSLMVAISSVSCAGAPPWLWLRVSIPAAPSASPRRAPRSGRPRPRARADRDSCRVRPATA